MWVVLIIITNMILISLEDYKQLNLRGSARQRQEGRDNISVYYYHLYYWLMSKNKWESCKSAVWKPWAQSCELFQEETVNYPSLLRANACSFRQKEKLLMVKLYFLPQCIYVKEQENRSICNWGFTQLKGKTDSVITAHHWCLHSCSVPRRLSFKMYVSCLYSN